MTVSRSFPTQPPLGVRGMRSQRVTPELTAAAGGNCGAEVLATPFLVFLLENACVDAMQDFLPEEGLTVGTHVDVRHLSPSPVGQTVHAYAQLVDVQGERFTFDVWARDAFDEVARGRHTRALVSRESFQARVSTKAEALRSSAEPRERGDV